jgi:hypothetical protein
VNLSQFLDSQRYDIAQLCGEVRNSSNLRVAFLGVRGAFDELTLNIEQLS